MDLDKYVALFRADGREHLAQCNALLLEWERAPAASAPVDGLFRAIHTIKGMAATMGYTRLADLSHALESLLATIRDQGRTADPGTIDLCFQAVDLLEAGIDPAADGRDAELPVDGVLAGLRRAVGPQTTGEEDPGDVDVHRTGEFAIPVGLGAPAGRPIRVTLRHDGEMLGARAALVLLKAELLGKVSAVFPPREALQGPAFGGDLSFRLATAASDERIREAIREAGDVLSVLVGDRPAAATRMAGRQVRVTLQRLDDLLNQVSELVVATNQLTELAIGAPGSPLETLSGRIGRLVSQAQASVTEARLAPVAEVFDRFPRPIRDLARQLEKRVAFVIEGGDIELDRSLLDELGDPLLHLLRNAVDHGLESPEERVRAGKTPEGRILLRATREHNSVLILVRDDGRGIDREAVTGKARRERFLGAAATLDSDEDLLTLLGRPGFSTSREVTGVSGRGVGIDVVLTRLRQLGGRVSLHTKSGVGTTFELRLPLTLAIVQALIVGVGTERYAMPLAHIVETGQVEEVPVRATGGTISYRGATLPAVVLRGVTGAPGPDRAAVRAPVVVVDQGHRRIGLVVDTLVGRQHIVVEPVDAPRGVPRWINGAAILGDGVPILVLDPMVLV